MENLRIEKECPYCGEKILVQAKKCKFCNEIIDPALRAVEEMKSKPKHKVFVVDDTGLNIVDSDSPDSVVVKKSRITYIVLGIFLGELGIHNFYAGYSGKGAAQLLITLLTGWLIIPLVVVGIWVIIELCTVELDAGGNKLI